MSAAECASTLATMNLHRFDAIVLLVGSTEAVSLKSGQQWAESLGTLLDQVELSTLGGLHTFVVGIPPVSSFSGLPPIFSRLVGGSIRRLNEVSREVCREYELVTFLEFEAPDLPRSGRNTSASYSNWASLIAPSIYLTMARATIQRPSQSAVDEFGRQRALEELNVLDTYPNPAIDRLVLSARNLFGTSSAAVTFLDRQRRWVKSAVGTPLDDSPRSESYCDLAIAEPGIFIVEDTHAEPAVLPSARLQEEVRFYAGYPIEAPSGHRVGVLCIMDDHPHQFGQSESALLRDLALQIQAELWHAR
jgi:hypothetical protein